MTIVTRRSLLKYAAAMGATLALPAGAVLSALPVAAAPEHGRYLTLPACIDFPDDIAPRLHADDEYIDWLSEQATNMFRRDDFVVGDCSMAQCDTWPANRALLVTEITDCLIETGMKPLGATLHTQNIIWHVELQAAGFQSDQCHVTWPVIDGVRRMALVCSTDGAQA